jgi:elongation factor Ts
MSVVTASMVKDLRERTGLPMMECKQALTECDGDGDVAMEWLRKKHKGKMSERSGKETGEGRIGVYIDPDSKVGAIIQLQCETAPVAKNELFIELADQIAAEVAGGSVPQPDSEAIRKIESIDTKFTEVFGKLREAMNLHSCRKVEGAFLSSYVHHDGKSGVLLALDAKPSTDKNVAGDLCMHALFTRPLAIDRSGVPADQVEKVREEAIAGAKADGKPDQIVEKIAEGKVNAFFGQSVLLEQLHVKTDDYGKAKIVDVLKESGVNTVTDLAIMKVGA